MILRARGPVGICRRTGCSLFIPLPRADPARQSAMAIGITGDIAQEMPARNANLKAREPA